MDCLSDRHTLLASHAQRCALRQVARSTSHGACLPWCCCLAWRDDCQQRTALLRTNEHLDAWDKGLAAPQVGGAGSAQQQQEEGRMHDRRLPAPSLGPPSAAAAPTGCTHNACRTQMHKVLQRSVGAEPAGSANSTPEQLPRRSHPPGPVLRAGCLPGTSSQTGGHSAAADRTAGCVRVGSGRGG